MNYRGLKSLKSDTHTRTHTHTSERQLKITFLNVLDYSEYSDTNISNFFWRNPSGAGILGLYGYKSHLTHYLATMAPSRDVLAEAQIEFKLTNVPTGKVAVAKWRGKPVFVYHR